MTRRLAQAYDLAARAHAGQMRKGAVPVPYINHPVAVARAVAEAGEGEAAVIAAVLHDVVEDTAVSAKEIEAAFGPEVAALVAALTDPPEWAALSARDRKAQQAEKLATAPRAARAVKIADQTANLQGVRADLSQWSRARNLAYLEGAVQVVDACRGANPALEALFDAAAEDLAEALLGAAGG